MGPSVCEENLQPLWLEKKGVAVHAAMGDGGNMICWVPDRNLVAAIASGFAPDAKNRWLLVRDYILPAVEENRV